MSQTTREGVKVGPARRALAFPIASTGSTIRSGKRMTLIDLAKAAAIAIALLLVNVCIAIVVVAVYAVLIEPGRSREFYDAAALSIAPWCSHIAGTALFFAAGFLSAGRRTSRDGFLFAGIFTALYAVIDAATVGFAGVLEFEFALSMLAKLLASLAGAFVASRRGRSVAGAQR